MQKTTNHETANGGGVLTDDIRLMHVGYQQRYICPDEGPSTWQFCDRRTAEILQNRDDYELRKIYAIEA